MQDFEGNQQLTGRGILQNRILKDQILKNGVKQDLEIIKQTDPETQLKDLDLENQATIGDVVDGDLLEYFESMQKTMPEILQEIFKVIKGLSRENILSFINEFKKTTPTTSITQPITTTDIIDDNTPIEPSANNPNDPKITVAKPKELGRQEYKNEIIQVNPEFKEILTYFDNLPDDNNGDYFLKGMEKEIQTRSDPKVNHITLKKQYDVLKTYVDNFYRV